MARPPSTPEVIDRDSIYTSRELRKRFRIGDDTWRQMRRNGLKTTRLGKVVLITGEEVLRFCEQEGESSA